LVSAILQTEGLRPLTDHAEPIFLVKPPSALVSGDVLELQNRRAVFTCRGNQLVEHRRTDAQAPAFTADRDPNRRAMPGFDAAMTAEFTVADNLAVEITGDCQSVGGFPQVPDPCLFAFNRHIPFFRASRQKIGLTAAGLNEVQHLFAVADLRCFQNGCAAVL